MFFFFFVWNQYTRLDSGPWGRSPSEPAFPSDSTSIERGMHEVLANSKHGTNKSFEREASETKCEARVSEVPETGRKDTPVARHGNKSPWGQRTPQSPMCIEQNTNQVHFFPGVDSPFFAISSFFSNTCRFCWVSGGFLERFGSLERMVGRYP